MKQLKKPNRTKAWVGAAISAAASIASAVLKNIQQQKEIEKQQELIDNENNVRWAQALNKAYGDQSAVINEYNDKLAYAKRGGRYRTKCIDGADISGILNSIGGVANMAGNIAANSIALNSNIDPVQKVNLAGTINDVLADRRKKEIENNDFQINNQVPLFNYKPTVNTGSPISYGNRLRLGKYGLINRINN